MAANGEVVGQDGRRSGGDCGAVNVPREGAVGDVGALHRGGEDEARRSADGVGAVGGEARDHVGLAVLEGADVYRAVEDAGVAGVVEALGDEGVVALVDAGRAGRGAEVIVRQFVGRGGDDLRVRADCGRGAGVAKARSRWTGVACRGEDVVVAGGRGVAVDDGVADVAGVGGAVDAATLVGDVARDGAVDDAGVGGG